MNFLIFKSYTEKFLKQIIKLSENIEFISIGFQNRFFFKISSVIVLCFDVNNFINFSKKITIFYVKNGTQDFLIGID